MCGRRPASLPPASVPVCPMPSRALSTIQAAAAAAATCVPRIVAPVRPPSYVSSSTSKRGNWHYVLPLYPWECRVKSGVEAGSERQLHNTATGRSTSSIARAAWNVTFFGVNAVAPHAHADWLFCGPCLPTDARPATIPLHGTGAPDQTCPRTRVGA